MTYRIWYKDAWHFKRNTDNPKKVLEFASFEKAVEEAMVSGLAGAQIWKLEGTPRVAIDRVGDRQPTTNKLEF